MKHTATKRGAAIQFHPLTKGRWPQLERLFGPRGACAGCWCMWPRLSGAEFARGRGAGNRRAFERLVATGVPPGLLACQGAEPVAWCAVAPRGAYRRLENSRVLAPVDERPVWSVPCFFVARPFRRHGLTVRLLREAVRFAAARGARIVEGYPVEPRAGRTADAFAWTGLASAFRAAGFKEVLRRSETRPIMRFTLSAARARAARCGDAVEARDGARGRSGGPARGSASGSRAKRPRG